MSDTTQILLNAVHDSLNEARSNTEHLIDRGDSSDYQFLLHHIKSALFEVRYLNDQESPS